MSKNEMITLPREVVELALDAFTRGCPPDCKDGMTDSGGVHPWGEAALIECPSCQAVEALRAALKHPDTGNPATVPEGWKLVPVEPTRDMLDFAEKCVPKTPRAQYIAMLSAAPQPPTVKESLTVEPQQGEQEPYLYYDPENGDTWTQESINDGCCLPDGLIALYTK